MSCLHNLDRAWQPCIYDAWQSWKSVVKNINSRLLIVNSGLVMLTPRDILVAIMTGADLQICWDNPSYMYLMHIKCIIWNFNLLCKFFHLQIISIWQFDFNHINKWLLKKCLIQTLLLLGIPHERTRHWDLIRHCCSQIDWESVLIYNKAHIIRLMLNPSIQYDRAS